MSAKEKIKSALENLNTVLAPPVNTHKGGENIISRFNREAEPLIKQVKDALLDAIRLRLIDQIEPRGYYGNYTIAEVLEFGGELNDDQMTFLQKNKLMQESIKVSTHEVMIRNVHTNELVTKTVANVELERFENLFAKCEVLFDRYSDEVKLSPIFAEYVQVSIKQYYELLRSVELDYALV